MLYADFNNSLQWVNIINSLDVGIYLQKSQQKWTKMTWHYVYRYESTWLDQIILYIFEQKTYHFSTKKILKGTNGRQKTYEIFHVYSIFYSGFMCQTTVIFGITKDGSLVLNTLASWNCFTCRNLFQNGTNDMSECLTFETAFCKKAQNFV